MKRQWLWLGFVALAGYRCTVELDVPDPEGPRQLVVLAFMDCRDTSSLALVERTFGFNDPFPTTDTTFRGKAEVSLYRQGQVFAAFEPKADSYYFTAQHPAIGLDSAATLSVFHPLFGLAEATQEPPAVASVLSARLFSDLALPDGRVLARALEMRLKDSPAQDNYYEMHLGEKDSLLVDGLFLYSLEQVYADGADSEVQSFFAPSRGARLLTDEGVDGAEIRLLFAMDGTADALKEPYLYVRFVTQAYYSYMAYAAGSQSGGIFPAAAGQEPYTNFSGGGLGVFALYVEERIPIER
ncbi:MAG: DUF4249 family protein [Phaeodactylibacter sp.]|nr:DUF4249 family protein [Phaeodactylibacter sp.]MCB9273336.1 DUF4249 family protein [Lewinellaceae bacterium]